MGTIDFTDSIYDAQQGSQSAVRFIYDNTIPLFYKEAHAFMRDKNEADCAIRDAYLFIFDHLSTLEDNSKFLLWANEVCKNTCISRLSQQGAFNERIPAEAANLGEILPSSEFDSLINMNASLSPDYIRQCLMAVLDNLPDNQRVCAILWAEGYPLRSIARKLNLSPVSVNYTLAYALGNITNLIRQLDENGLPLFSMEPIPYFLWLLISYYQYYQPEEVDAGVESGLSNILRLLTPNSASVYAASYDSYGHREQEEVSGSGKVRQVADTAFASAFTKGAGSGQPGGDSGEPDISDFIRPEQGSAGADPGFDISDFIHETPASQTEEQGDAPEMDVYPAHQKSPVFSSYFGAGQDEDQTSGDSVSDEEKAPESDAAGQDEAADEEAAAGAAAAAGIAAAAGTAAAAEGTAEGAAAPGTAEGSSEGGAPEAAGVVPVSGEDGTDAQEPEKKKKHKALWIVLLVLLIIVCLIAGAFAILGNTLKQQINNLFGFNIFTQVEAVTEPETTTEEPTTPEPETTTEEPTTPEPTTEEPTTPEPTTEEPTTEEEVLGPDYHAQIYTGGLALSMKASPNGEHLLYVPDEYELYFDRVENGWGHTSYDGTEGWIWLEWTKVVGKARVQEPAEASVLETPAAYTIANDDRTVELRIGPGTYFSTFGPVPGGTQITAEAVEEAYGGSWAYITYNGQHGWVPMDDLWA